MVVGGDEKSRTVPAHAGTVWRAWHALRHDRQYGAFGGQSQISFLAIDRYATRYGIEGVEFEIFHSLLGAMEDEYALICAEQAKRDEEARKRQQEEQ